MELELDALQISMMISKANTEGSSVPKEGEPVLAELLKLQVTSKHLREDTFGSSANRICESLPLCVGVVLPVHGQPSSNWDRGHLGLKLLQELGPLLAQDHTPQHSIIVNGPLV